MGIGDDWVLAISIHAPRGGSDSALPVAGLLQFDFNPRSPWGERRNLPFQQFNQIVFQSTLPVGGATTFFFAGYVYHSISIHAPRGGSDTSTVPFPAAIADFNPRSPWGERRTVAQLRIIRSYISIHAPRGGSDQRFETLEFTSIDFNPRSPWGERRLES